MKDKLWITFGLQRSESIKNNYLSKLIGLIGLTKRDRWSSDITYNTAETNYRLC